MPGREYGLHKDTGSEKPVQVNNLQRLNNRIDGGWRHETAREKD